VPRFRCYSDQGVKSAAEYEAQWVQFFSQAPDTFELQRGLNNCFGYDIVPTVPILTEAFKAARRLNDFPTTVRTLVGLREKVENQKQYNLYLEALADLRTELGIPTPEEMGV
jgi:cytochrome c oxidase subunit 5a